MMGALGIGGPSVAAAASAFLSRPVFQTIKNDTHANGSLQRVVVLFTRG